MTDMERIRNLRKLAAGLEREVARLEEELKLERQRAEEWKMRAALAQPSPAPVDRYAQGFADGIERAAFCAEDQGKVAAEEVAGLIRALTAPAGDGAWTVVCVACGGLGWAVHASNKCPTCGGDGWVPGSPAPGHPGARSKCHPMCDQRDNFHDLRCPNAPGEPAAAKEGCPECQRDPHDPACPFAGTGKAKAGGT